MPRLPKILTIIGTRPEVIKMAPIAQLLDSYLGENHQVCSTGQQKDLVIQTCQQLQVRLDYQLSVMSAGQGMNVTVAKIITALQPILQSFSPDWVLVHGDTASCLGATLAAFYVKIKVAHVESGLRSGDLFNPFPEESIRIIVDQLASICFAPSTTAVCNLQEVGIDSSKIVVCGNTGIDMLKQILEQTRTYRPQHLPIALLKELQQGRRLIIVTVHRSESRGAPLEAICRTIGDLAEELPNVRFLVLLHPHPAVGPYLQKSLYAFPQVYLLPPLPYVEFIWAIQHSFLLLTDSGGIQEEAPYLGKPVLLLRNTTERPEAVQSQNVYMTGIDGEMIKSLVLRLWNDPLLYEKMSVKSQPYGRGNASEMIVKYLLESKFD